MRVRAAALLTACTVLMLTACDEGDDSTEGAPAAASSMVPSATATVTGTSLPDLTGNDLQSAQDAAQAAGYRRLASHDLLGTRSQLVDRNWQVCAQEPAAGPQPTSVLVDFGVIKTGETCPGQVTASPSTSPSPSPSISISPPEPPPVEVPPMVEAPVPPPIEEPTIPDPPSEPDNAQTGVRAGSYCSPAGAVGRTSVGTIVTCTSTASDSRNRWRR